VDGFDEDEAEGEGDEGAIVLRRILAAERHALEAFELTTELVETDTSPVERFHEEGGGFLTRPQKKPKTMDPQKRKTNTESVIASVRLQY
jgi:hypothetical protein